MNKKLHFLFFCLLIIFILCLCKDKLIEPYGGSGRLAGRILENFKNIEPFGNQIVIHPDNAELNPKETTFSILTYDSDLNSGVTQASICSDDSEWRKDDKTCIDYSISGSNCEDIGSDGRLAFDACKVSCDNCNTYTEVKRRLPSPIEDVDEPSYAQFEGSISDGSTGSDIGGPDYREIISRLDDMKDSMGTMSNDVVASSDLVSLSLDNMSEELRGSLSGVDSDGDGALTSEEFIQFMADPLGVRGAAANLAKGRILIQGKNTIERLLEVIGLFKINSELTDSKVPDLPVNTINVADYDTLEGDVQRLKTHIETLGSNTAPREIIRDIYKIIVYFARLDIPDNMGAVTAGDTYKSKLGDLEDKKSILLQKLVNMHLAAPNINSDNDADINIQINQANNIFNGDTFQTPNSRETAQYMSDILNALGEFRKILVDFKGSLQSDLNRASGVILPGTGGGFTQADIDAASEASRAEGKAEAERENAEDDAAEAAAAEKEEKDDKITAAEVGVVVGVVGVLGYFAARAADLLD